MVAHYNNLFPVEMSEETLKVLLPSIFQANSNPTEAFHHFRDSLGR